MLAASVPKPMYLENGFRSWYMTNVGAHLFAPDLPSFTFVYFGIKKGKKEQWNSDSLLRVPHF